MSDLATLLLYDAVSARFTSEGTSCALGFGWRERAKHVTGPRIVMVPGDEGGDAGEIGAPTQPGRNPLPLARFGEVFHVIVSGAGDATDPTNERAAYEATRLLFDAWFRAAWKWAGNRLGFVSAQWLIDRVTARYGTALLATFTMDAMIPDEPLLETDFIARGFITAQLLDVENTSETEPAPATARVAARTSITLSGTQTIDGVSVIATDRVLVVAQASGAANGIYVAAAGAWARADDTIENDLYIRVTAGDTGPALYRLNTEDPITPDVTAQTWTRITPE